MKPLKYGISQVFQFECSGKIIYANCHIIGINPDLETHGGYDSSLEEYLDPLTPDEKRELADYMIALWTQYKAIGSSPSVSPPAASPGDAAAL